MINLTDEQKKEFGNIFLAKYLAGEFGTMTKSEIDILVYHLISESEDLKDKSNYEIANTLLVPESKVKSLRLNASIKYKQANHKAVIASIVTRITETMDKPEFESGTVTITIENPAERTRIDRVSEANRDLIR